MRLCFLLYSEISQSFFPSYIRQYQLSLNEISVIVCFTQKQSHAGSICKSRFIKSFFRTFQLCLQLEQNLKILLYKGRKTPRR